MDTNNKNGRAKKTLWKFGKRDLRYVAIGTVLYIVFVLAASMFRFPYYLAQSNFIVVFFGLLFGPLVGFFVGLLGSLTFILFPGFYYCDWLTFLSEGMMGLVAGLGSGLLGPPADRSYKNWKMFLYGFWLWWDGVLVLLGQKDWKPILNLVLKVWKVVGFAALGWIVGIGINVLGWIWGENTSPVPITRVAIDIGTAFMVKIILLGLLLVGIIKRRENAMDTISNHP